MPLPKYDFVNVSTTQLPYVHDSFPAGNRIGTVKYYTMRSVYRDRQTGLPHIGRSEQKETLELKLPELPFVSKGFGRRKRNIPATIKPSNIDRQKAYFRLKGIPFHQMYSLHRTKPDRFDNFGNFSSKESFDNRSVSLDKYWKQSDIAQSEYTQNETTGEETNSIFTSESGYSSVNRKSRLQAMDRESPILGLRQGRQSRNNQSRKLGNIVSSKRLQQLLDNDDPLDPDDFYYY